MSVSSQLPLSPLQAPQKDSSSTPNISVKSERVYYPEGTGLFLLSIAWTRTLNSTLNPGTEVRCDESSHTCFMHTSFFGGLSHGSFQKEHV